MSLVVAKMPSFSSSSAVGALGLTHLVINGVSLLKTELGNGQPHHVLVGNFQAPAGEKMERGHRPPDAGAAVGPHALTDAC